jgi:feruloyl esterase
MEKNRLSKKFENVRIENGVITQIQLVDNGEFNLPEGKCLIGLPAFCKVTVNLKPTSSSNINVEIWLPETIWNGRFLGTGNGGGAGGIVYEALADGIMQGYATANTDMGTSPNANYVVDLPERYIDFGYRATHEMTLVAKEIIQKYYNKPISYSYFKGDSTGGQQALMEAQRYPSDYKGIIAGVPANNRTLLHTAFLWNYKALNQGIESSLLPEKIALITKKMLSLRSGKDGGTLDDKFFTDPRSVEFKLNDVLNDIDLNHKQLAALKKIYTGPVNPRTGEQIYTHIPFGSENSPLGLQYQQDPHNFPNSLFYIFRWAFGENFEWQKFDFDHDLDVLQERLAPILNANNPDLSELKEFGGKILMFSGTADPLVPYQDALNYYERVIDEQQGIEATQEFFRYFLIPGRCHGEEGSPGFSRVSGSIKGESILSALVEWVEQGKAPNQLIATAYKDGCTSNEIVAQRPVYPYPKFAEYVGGEPNSISSYKGIDHPRGNVTKPNNRYLHR